MIAWLATVALSGELRPVGSADTVESIALELGDAGLADRIRAANDLRRGQQPAIGVLLELPAPPVPHAEQQAFLLASMGAVTVTARGANPTAAVPFVPLPQGATVCTGPQSWATLRVAAACNGDGLESDDVILASDTCVEVRSAFASLLGRSTVVRVIEGSVSVAELQGAGRVSVETDSGITTGTGGGFRVHVEADHAMRAEALFAGVAVLGSGAEQLLVAGQGSRVRVGQAPSAAVDLLDVDALVSPRPGEPLLRPRFSWTADDDALGWRIEIATERDFLRLVYQEDVTVPFHAPDLLMLPFRSTGGLWWRVSALDRFGFLGVPTAPGPLTLPSEVGP